MVYDRGWRLSTGLFAAFCLERDSVDGPRFGFTLPRAVGKAVHRNRIRRRLREIIRLEQHRFPAKCWIVFNPRRVAEDAPIDRLRADVEKLIARCTR